MSIHFKSVVKNPYLFLSTGFGIGLIPFAPGTLGSGLGLCIYIFFAHFSYPNVNGFLLLILLLIIGTFIVNQSLKEIGSKDHQEIIIDELLAMMLVAHFIPPEPKWAIAAFLIFRFFDIAKPYPIKKIDKIYKNAFGIMADDVVAAIYSIIIISALKYLLI